ncbi:MAG: tRNA (adenosine(37)-N6)-threonylcarbamoyltransferase complex ATPase subunit type 1 TsaE [Pseudomonadota bacterium]
MATAEQMEALGASFASAGVRRGIVHLVGELGSGKTTFVRGYLRGSGWRESVKSPTYTIVEPYEQSELRVYHFDLYRIGDPDELEWMGFRDYCRDDALLFIEWPERAEGYLPSPTAALDFQWSRSGRTVTLIANALSPQLRAKIGQISL